MEEEEKETKKTDSKKFVVWLVWIVMALITLCTFIIAMFITKQIPDNLVELVQSIIRYAFIISCEFIGCNVIQKGVYAAKDIFGKNNTEDTDDR